MIRTIRNDDVAADTTLSEIATFCEICDRYGVKPMHAITPVGKVRSINIGWNNHLIRELSGTALFSENTPVVEYLLKRQDLIAVHGLWHTHTPREAEINAAWFLLADAGFKPKYFVPPFNEYPRMDQVCGMLISGRECPRLEEYLENGDPESDIAYLHSWRFEHGPFRWEQLDRCLRRLNSTTPSSIAAIHPQTTGFSTS